MADYNINVIQEQISNPKSTVNKTKRVAMLQIEDRNDHYFQFCINLNKEYCKKFNIDHIYLKKGPSDIPPYWWKVQVFLDLMNLGKHDIICWMDSDAFVYNTDIDIRDIFGEYSETMLVCSDPPGWGSPFMAAVYMCRNDSKGRQIFEEWMNLYNKTKWKKGEDGKWKYVGTGKWAGVDYEQGAYAQKILPKYRKIIKSLPWYIFHETNCAKPHKNAWSIHIPGAIKQVRQPCVINEQSRRRRQRVNLTFMILAIILLILLIVLIIYKWFFEKK